MKLRGLEELAQVAVYTERLRDPTWIIASRGLPRIVSAGKRPGQAVIVMWPEANAVNTADDAGRFVDEIKLTVRVMEDPLFRGSGGREAMELAEIALNKLWSWHPAGEPGLVLYPEYPTVIVANDPWRGMRETSWDKWAKKIRPMGDMISSVVLDVRMTTMASRDVSGRTTQRMEII